jgi:hypothetical protein
MRKEIYRIFAAMAVVFLVASALWAIGPHTRFEVSSTIPTDGARGVALDQALTATFNQDVNCTTIETSGAFTLTSRTGYHRVAVGGTVTCSGTVATFTPSSPLAANTTYTATITDNVKDVGGKRLEGKFEWCFKTGTSLVAPTVTAVAPVNMATGVALNTKVTAAFDQAMNPASINTSTFTLTYGPHNTRVRGTVTYDVLNNIATFTPNALLKANTVYTATITACTTADGMMMIFPACGCTSTIACVKNLAGTGLVSAFVWTFKTGGASITTRPTVISTNPANPPISCVPTNQIITATFSEAMNSLSVTGPPPPAPPAPQFTLQETSTLAYVQGVVTYSAVGNMATFTPNALLTAGTEYTATILTGVMDLEGNQLVANYSWNFTTCVSPSTLNPGLTVLSTFPTGTGACVSGAISATFSEPLEPATINTGTFTVVGPALVPVLGTVSLDPTGLAATFTPLSALATNTTYTATLAATVTDIYGDTLYDTYTGPYVWYFTTGSATVCGPAPLGAIESFGAFGGYSGITNQGLNTSINGESIGTTAVSTTVTGFHDTTEPYDYTPYKGCIYTETTSNVGVVNQEIYTAAPPPNATLPLSCPNEGTGPATLVGTTAYVATQALAAATTEWNALATMPGGLDPTPGLDEDLGGLTLTAGTYKAAYGAFNISSNLTLTGPGVFVFQMPSSLTVGSNTVPSNVSVILGPGALASNVYWQVGSAATINYGGGGTMVGTIIAYSAVTISSPGNSSNPPAQNTVLDGRAISLTGSVTMVQTTINAP